MPTGVYKRPVVIPGAFKNGHVPHNRGVQEPHVQKRYQAVKDGKAVECKFHGTHEEWRLHSSNNVQCKLCMSEKAKNKRLANPIKTMLRDAKARKRGFDLEESDILELLINQGNLCALSGIVFDLVNKPSIDRIDSSKGYLKGNVQLVTYEINRMKSDLNMQEFLFLCERVVYNKAGKGKKSKKSKR